jgi:PKD repeat protein
MRTLILAPAMLALVACGGDGGGDGERPNVEPTASISVVPRCGQAPLTVSFDASASRDLDGEIASFRWIFGDGASATGPVVSHSYATPGTFGATLVVTDDEGAASTAMVDITAIAGPVPPSVTIGGMVTFERVPFSTNDNKGLDYTRTFEAPARAVEVELVRSSDQATIQAVVTDSMGRYQFAAPTSTDVFVRARAQSRPAGAPPAQASTWNIRVLDNTSANALYVLAGSSFHTCVVNHTRNLKATTGWGGEFAGVYTGPRAAAPFAILDSMYAAAQFVIAEGGGPVQWPALDVYWSVDNKPAVPWNPAIGDIETTLYRPLGQPAIPAGVYVLGAAGSDTDEFDQHVLAHEFLHYLEDVLGRTDSVGGRHGLRERLDMRVAFSEGLADAFAAMVLDDPVYRDSVGTAQASDVSFDMESDPIVEPDLTNAPGWYNEASVHRIAWDLFDPVSSSDVPRDDVALGYAPMHAVLTGAMASGVPLTSLFGFITALKQQPNVPVAAVDARVEAEGRAGTSLGIVSTGMNAYATTETHSGVAASSAGLVLPIYSPIGIGTGPVRLCTDAALDVEADGGVVSVPGSYNKLGNRRFLRFSVPAAQTAAVRVSCSDTDDACRGTPVPDPDFVLSRASDRVVARSIGRIEEKAVDLTAGDYVLEIYEYSHVDREATTRRGRTCMTVTIGPS